MRDGRSDGQRRAIGLVIRDDGGDGDGGGDDEG